VENMGSALYPNGHRYPCGHRRANNANRIIWVNESTLPYKLSIKNLNKEGKNLPVRIKKERKNKDLSNLSKKELKQLANTPEGRSLRRLILRLHCPLKTPKSLN